MKIEHSCSIETRGTFYDIECPKCVVNEQRAQLAYSVEFDPDLSMTWQEPNKYGAKPSLSRIDGDWGEEYDDL